MNSIHRLLAFTALFTLAAVPALADETVGEKAASTGRDAKRAIKRGTNRVGEAFCAEGDIKCAAKKGGNRVEETVDAAKDKVKDAKAKID